MLDFVPNAVHAGIYRAIAAGYYRRHNIDLKVIQPTSTADTLRLINADKADFGLADGLDVGNQIQRGLDIEAFLAIVQKPLGGVITLEKDGIASGRDLEGKTVGVTGVPSDNAVLDTIVDHAGGDPSKVKVVTIGFNGVQNLESGKIAGFTGFWPADGVQVNVDGKPTKDFKLDENGGPAYPGLVAFSTRSHIAQRPGADQERSRPRRSRATRTRSADPATSLERSAGPERVAQRGHHESAARRLRARSSRATPRGSARSTPERSTRSPPGWSRGDSRAAPFTAAEYGGDSYLPAG